MILVCLLILLYFKGIPSFINLELEGIVFTGGSEIGVLFRRLVKM